MRPVNLIRPALSVGLTLLTSVAAVADSPRGYWVQSSGYFDRFPFPPAVGGQSHYSTGRPWVTLQDPFGSRVSMPLQPKVLYYDTPFATPGGYYYPRSMVVIPDDRRRAVPQRVRQSLAPRTFRYDGGPTTPVPEVAPAPLPRIEKR